MKFATADDVIDVLQALPPKALAAVFPDNSSHLHLAVRDGAYRIGLGFEGEFFPTKLEQAEAKKNAVKGKRHTDHPRAVWLEKWSSKVFTSKATWDDAAQKWTWSPKRETGDDARDKLKSEPLKDALKALQPAPMNEATEAEIESDGG